MSDIANILFASSVFMLFIMAGVIFLFNTFNARKNQLLKEQLEQKLRAQKKLHRSELKVLQNQLNPHFVHNSLNAIQYFVQRNEVEVSEKYLSQFSKLMRQFFDYSRRKKVTLLEEKDFLENYLSMEQLRFEEKLCFKIVADEALDLESIEIPAMLLQPMVENAINHGIFHSKHDGILDICFKEVPETMDLEIQIVDNGVGINTSRARKVQAHDTHTSHSGQVLEERLEVLNDTEEWDITYTITDRSTHEKSSGTRIVLLFENAIL